MYIIQINLLNKSGKKYLKYSDAPILYYKNYHVKYKDKYINIYDKFINNDNWNTLVKRYKNLLNECNF